MTKAILALIAAVAAIVSAITLVLRLPGIPYNVAELFLDRSSSVALTFFALALLWTGGGAMLLSHALARSRRPYVALPIGLLVVSLIGKFLLSRSVTYESLDDILGSNTLFAAVTQRDVWGPFWRNVFLTTNAPGLVDFVERRVRFAALYSIPELFMALALLVTVARQGAHRSPRAAARRLGWIDFLMLTLSAACCLSLCHLIVITWAATDNLTELIAGDGLPGVGGTLYLYALTALVAVNVGLLIDATNRTGRWALALAASVAAVPLGWILLTSGLEQQVSKYGAVFSGEQFLLGPDRRHALSPVVLLARWTLVELSAVAIGSVGAWIADGFVRAATSSPRPAAGAAS